MPYEFYAVVDDELGPEAIHRLLSWFQNVDERHIIRLSAERVEADKLTPSVTSTKSILEQSIRILDLNAQSYGALVRRAIIVDGIDSPTIGWLVNLTVEDLLDATKNGEVRLNELATKLAVFGLKLKDS